MNNNSYFHAFNEDYNSPEGNMYDPSSASAAAAAHHSLLLAVHSSTSVAAAAPQAAATWGGYPAAVTNSRSFEDLVQLAGFGSPPVADPPGKTWLDEIKISVKDVSVDDLTGRQVLELVQEKANDVQGFYIPCVDFLVHCQQELRKGVDQSRMTGMTFYKHFIEGLPDFFYMRNSAMENASLVECIKGLQNLRNDARNTVYQGPESVKAAFLGGMKDGRSWGLRLWLSRNGKANSVCTMLECVLTSIRNHEQSQALSDLLRPVVQPALDRLKADIPDSYQKHSAAHPYLPYFHRLESALRGLAQFDPSRDTVIELSDDDEDEVEIVEAPKRKLKTAAQPPSKKRARLKRGDDDSSSGESVSHAVIFSKPVWPNKVENGPEKLQRLLDRLDRFTVHDGIRRVNDDFWSTSFSKCLGIIRSILEKPNSMFYLHKISDAGLLECGCLPVSHVLKYNYGFTDIIENLVSGKLGKFSLWNAVDLLTVVDLVFLSHLAYGKTIIKRDAHRNRTNKLRKVLWDGLKGIPKSSWPTRRSETSGYVIHKVRL